MEKPINKLELMVAKDLGGLGIWEPFVKSQGIASHHPRLKIWALITMNEMAEFLTSTSPLQSSYGIFKRK